LNQCDREAGALCPASRFLQHPKTIDALKGEEINTPRKQYRFVMRADGREYLASQ
jgi:hypothetical protein